MIVSNGNFLRYSLGLLVIDSNLNSLIMNYVGKTYVEGCVNSKVSKFISSDSNDVAKFLDKEPLDIKITDIIVLDDYVLEPLYKPMKSLVKIEYLIDGETNKIISKKIINTESLEALILGGE